jgi:hypothetical protein
VEEVPLETRVELEEGEEEDSVELKQQDVVLVGEDGGDGGQRGEEGHLAEGVLLVEEAEHEALALDAAAPAEDLVELGAELALLEDLVVALQPH